MAEQEITPMEPVRPLVSPEEAGQMMTAYQALCMKILVPWEGRRFEKGPGGVDVLVQDSDFQRIQVYDKVTKRTYERDFPKKSAFRKLSLFYGVSTEPVSKERALKEGGGFVWTYRVRASITGKDGRVRSVTQEGSCDSMEKASQNTRVEHDCASTALTRATNRAISDLIGFGQVSAEEMTPGGTQEPRKIVPSEANAVKEKPTPAQPSREFGATEVLTRAGIDPRTVEIVHEGGVTYISPTPGLVDWAGAKVALEGIGYIWNAAAMRWERAGHAKAASAS